MTELRDDKRFYGIGEVLALSWPAGLSMLNSTLMRFVDGLMVSWISPAAMTAQLVAGIASFVPESFATGLLTVTNTYVSQNLGAGRKDKCGQYAWAGLALALAFCFAIVPLVFVAAPIFNFYNRSLPQTPEVLELTGLEIMYFRYMVLAVFLTLTARPLEQFFYGVHRPRVVLMASIFANVANVVLAYILVFGQSGLGAIDRFLHIDLTHSWVGRLGLAKHGLEGAAWANLVSWGMYLVILLVLFTSHKMNLLYRTRRVYVELRELWDLVRIGWPAGVQFINDVLPWSLLLGWLVNKFGFVHQAATSAAMRWMPLSFMPAVGIGIATTALVGKYIGQGRPDIARRRTRAAMALAIVYMACCGTVFFVFRHPLVSLFISTDGGTPAQQAQMLAEAANIVRIGGYVMICAAIFQLFDAVGIVFIGALRGAGDTLWPMIVTSCLSWGMTVGGGYLMTLALPQLGSIGPWIAASLYIVVLGLVVAARFEGGAWQRIRLLGPIPAEPASDTPMPPMPPSSPPSPPSTM